MKKFLLIPVVSALLAGCAATQDEADEGPRAVSVLASRDAKPTAPAIVDIVSRDSRITVRASQAGPTYSLTKLNGDRVISDMTLPQLQAIHPDLAHHVETMNAAASSTTWAGLE